MAERSEIFEYLDGLKETRNVRQINDGGWYALDLYDIPTLLEILVAAKFGLTINSADMFVEEWLNNNKLV